MNLPHIVILREISWHGYINCVGDSMIERLMVMVLNFQMAFSRILPSMHKNELLVGITGAVAVKLLVYERKMPKVPAGVERFGKMGTAKDIATLYRPGIENNILLTMTERLTMNGRPKNPKFARNKNVIVIDGSGSGKTRFYVKPNLMQMGKYISYVGHGPERTITWLSAEKMLVRHGYKAESIEYDQFFQEYALYPLPLYPFRKGYFETGKYDYGEHERGRREVQ